MRGFWRTTSAFGLCVAGTAIALPAQAQVVAPTRDELTRQQPTTAPDTPKLDVIGDIERSPCPLADPRFADIKVTISEVRFNGLKGATEAELAPSWSAYAGREMPVAILCEVRDAAATILRSKGYLAAVQVPTQRIDNGVVTMETLFARVVAVRARGQTEGAEDKLVAYLSKLEQDEIFNRYRAERYLLLARDLPGYNVQLTLKPAGTGPGDLIGEVAVLRRTYLVDATVSNLASKATGRWGGQLRAQLFGLTGLGDVTTLSGYSTADFKEQKVLQLAHSFRPGSEGLTIDGMVTYAWSKPDIDAGGAVPDLIARTFYASLGARYPLVRSQKSNLWLGGGMDFLNQKVRFFGPQSEDKLRIGYLRANWDSFDRVSAMPGWRAAATVELRKGFDIFGASDECPNDACPVGVIGPSRGDADPTAALLRAAGQFDLAVGKSLAIGFSPRAQVAFAPLAAFEEFTLGNYTVGRGYDPATESGDSGVGIATELRTKAFDIARGAATLAPYVFGDAGWAWNKNGGDDPRHVKSAGGGVRAEMGNFRLDASLAVPLERAGIADRKGGPRLLVTLTSRLLPWRS